MSGSHRSSEGTLSSVWSAEQPAASSCGHDLHMVFCTLLVLLLGPLRLANTAGTSGFNLLARPLQYTLLVQ